ncbi:MAG: sigma-54 dependent transcriptional regulator [Planctomycetota bacterium]
MSTNRERLDVLVVDDEQSMREFLEIVLANEGLEVATASSGEEALQMIAQRPPKVFIQDLRMGGIDGMQLLEKAKELQPTMPVVIITAYSSWDTAVEAMRLGAFDYLKKPFDNENIRSIVQRALSVAENPGDPSAVERLIVGNSPPMQRLHDLIRRVAPTDSTVLIRGESGSGKELVARSVHASSHRAERPFIAVNCSAFADTLLESELFGHVRGAYTGASDDRKGLFEMAHGGTLFLDEVADMSATTQVKILRVLEERRLLPVGGSNEVSVDVRIVAATNRDLEQDIREQRFREDLFYRLNVIPFHLPPMRERPDDIPLLAGHFMARYAETMRKDVRRLSPRAQAQLMNHSWPGNVRELQNVIQRHVALSDGEEIENLDLEAAGAAAAPAAAGGAELLDQYALETDGFMLDEVMEQIERRFLCSALEQTSGNLTQAAKMLGVSYRSIRYKVKKLGVRANQVTTDG